MAEREPEDLPLDELRRAWRGLEPELPADDLDRVDARTRASVEWMRAAWSDLAVPEPRIPTPRSRRMRVPLRVGVAAAAAALALFWIAESELPAQRPEELARNPFEGTITPSDVETPQLAALSSDHIELRSGPVRLILLTDRRQ